VQQESAILGDTAARTKEPGGMPTSPDPFVDEMTAFETPLRLAQGFAGVPAPEAAQSIPRREVGVTAGPNETSLDASEASITG
jgi:hypothetical protein